MQPLNTLMINETFHIKLEYHDTLNPKLWTENQTLRPEVKQHLFSIAMEWAEFAKIPPEAITDILMAGGNANYNWTETSDIDVHFSYDASKMPIKDPELLMDFFFTKKDLWAKKHHILIRGYPVELFAEPNTKKHPEGQGVWSLLHDSWVQKPSHQDFDWEHNRELRRDVWRNMQHINKITKGQVPLDDASAYKDSLRAKRFASILQDGEFAHDQLVFKDLRNRGLLDKLASYILKAKDSKLSL